MSTADQQPFPATPADITPEWLTAALQHAGALRSARVIALRSEQVGEGLGFVGHLARVIPTYDVAEAAAPATLLAKFASSQEGARRTAALLGLYAREVGFYRDLAHRAGVGTPRCYAAECSSDGARFLLLLEDLRDGAFGDQVAGATIEQARIALTEIARFHAHWWNSPELASVPWLQHSVQVTQRTIGAAYAQLWPVFQARFAGRIPPSLAQHGPALGTRVLAMLQRQSVRDTYTLRHSDYRLDNLFFPGAGTRPLVVVDWQGAFKSWSGAYDAAYFVATGLTIEDRRAHGADLLDLYYRTLVDAGVSGYSRDLFEQDCRDGYLATLAVIGIIAGAMLETTNQRAVDLFTGIFTRMVASIDDADAWGVAAG
jgi:hypothetical protein